MSAITDFAWHEQRNSADDAAEHLESLERQHVFPLDGLPAALLTQSLGGEPFVRRIFSPYIVALPNTGCSGQRLRR